MTTEAPIRAEHVATYRYTTAMDNHEPTRAYAHGTLDAFIWPDTGQLSYRLPGGLDDFKEASRAVFLIDDGRTVLPLYATGWNPATGIVFLGLFPVNVNAEGTPKVREDNGRPVDYGDWMLGPRRAYHLKITEV